MKTRTVKFDNLVLDETTEEKVLRFLRKNQYVTATICTTQLNIPVQTASNTLRRMARAKLIKDLGIKRIKSENKFRLVHVYTELA